MNPTSEEVRELLEVAALLLTIIVALLAIAY